MGKLEHSQVCVIIQLSGEETNQGGHVRGTAEDGVYPVRVIAWRWRAWRAVTRPARPSCIAAGNVRLTP